MSGAVLGFVKRRLKALLGLRARPVSGSADYDRLLLRLRKGDLAIDCGANIGNMTELMAANGATVYAFEPNPHAFAKLRERFAGRKNVHCLNVAAATQDGVLKLYLHKQANEDPLAWSQASSLLESKSNVDADNWVEVPTVDFCAFAAGLGRKITLLKMDVEGAEVDILERLLDLGQDALFETVLVETHDRKIPGLRDRTQALRERIARQGLGHFRLDWI